MSHRERKRLLACFLTVVALHALLLLVPSVREGVLTRFDDTPLTIRLVAERAESPGPDTPVAAAEAEQRIEPAPPTPEPPVSIVDEPTEADPVAPIPETGENRQAEAAPDRETAPALLARIMSSPYLDEGQSQFNPFPEDSNRTASSSRFRFADRLTPDPLIYREPVPLPFADAPRVAVEFYDSGVMGGMQRFWDSVTFARTWTTENGTRISCGVLLIIPACAWD